jgi:P-type E1-E2 ATPase
LRQRQRRRQRNDNNAPTAATPARSRPARVLRDGAEISAPAETLAPGDVVLVATGEPVPTDGRILAGSLSVDQQQLTGEPPRRPAAPPPCWSLPPPACRA